MRKRNYRYRSWKACAIAQNIKTPIFEMTSSYIIHILHISTLTRTNTNLIAEHGEQAREFEVQHLRRQTQQQLDDGQRDRRAHHLEGLVLHQVLVQLRRRAVSVRLGEQKHTGW